MQFTLSYEVWTEVEDSRYAFGTRHVFVVKRSLGAWVVFKQPLAYLL